MKESDKNLEKFIDKIMRENTLDSPSIDFTSKIMSQILVSKKNNVKPYKPLISLPVWIVILGSLVFLILYTAFDKQSYNLEISPLNTVNISGIFSYFQFSKNTMYAILTVPFMLLVQIAVLKNYYNKKYQL